MHADKGWSRGIDDVEAGDLNLQVRLLLGNSPLMSPRSLRYSECLLGKFLFMYHFKSFNFYEIHERGLSVSTDATEGRVRTCVIRYAEGKLLASSPDHL